MDTLAFMALAAGGFLLWKSQSGGLAEKDGDAAGTAPLLTPGSSAAVIPGVANPAATAMDAWNHVSVGPSSMTRGQHRRGKTAQGGTGASTLPPTPTIGSMLVPTVTPFIPTRVYASGASSGAPPGQGLYKQGAATAQDGYQADPYVVAQKMNADARDNDAKAAAAARFGAQTATAAWVQSRDLNSASAASLTARAAAARARGAGGAGFTGDPGALYDRMAALATGAAQASESNRLALQARQEAAWQGSVAQVGTASTMTPADRAAAMASARTLMASRGRSS